MHTELPQTAMIPQLQDFGEGYNDLEKLEALQKHLQYYSVQEVRAPPPKKESNEQLIRQITEEYLHTELTPDEVSQINKVISGLDEERQMLMKRLNLLYDKKNNEHELINQNISLLDRLKALNYEKLDLKKKNNTQLQIVNSLLNTVYSLNHEFTMRMQELTKYNNQLPNEREVELSKQNEKLKSEVEQLRLINQQVEYVQAMLGQAEQTKQIVIEQLRYIQSYRQQG